MMVAEHHLTQKAISGVVLEMSALWKKAKAFHSQSGDLFALVGILRGFDIHWSSKSK